MDPVPHPILYPPEQVREGVIRLARGVLERVEGSLDLLVLLEGARPLARDLSAELLRRRPGLALRRHFLKVRGTSGAALLGDRRMEGPGPDWAAMGKSPILLLDDLWDSGRTLEAAAALCRERVGVEPKTAVLVRKFTPPEGKGPDLFGLALDLDPKDLAARGLRDLWLFGYGMDLDGRHRDLAHIACVEVR